MIAFVLLASMVATPASAAIVKVANVRASSTEVDPSGTVSYAASNLIDAKASTVWVEGEQGSGLGSWVEFDLGGSRTITGLRIWNGNWYTTDFWQRHNRVKNLTVRFSDGSEQDFTLADEQKPEEIHFKKPVTTSSVKLFIKGIYSGTTFNDTCLSEVQVLDPAPSDTIPVASVAASSVYPPDTDGSYEPVNVGDGLLDTMWCEGDEEGDGTGEWIEFDFGQPRTVSKFRLSNGNAYSFAFNMKGNRARSMQLSFSDGSTETVEVKPTMLPQVVSFPAHTTSKVKVTFTGVVRGMTYNDLCISEMNFLK